MIRRGAAASRFTALSIVAAPVVTLAVLAGGGALEQWREAGDGLRSAAERRHAAAAQAVQAALYEPLGEAWMDYAATDASGLDQSETEAAALITLKARLVALFESRDGVVNSVQTLPRHEDVDGLVRLGVEVRGVAPQPALAPLLATLETETPLLFVEHLDIERRAETLALVLRVSMYRLGPEGEAQ